MFPKYRETAEFRDDAWVAQWIVLDAGAQAARVRSQASAQTATIRAAAEREAEEVRRLASVQAAVIREAAEREAAQLRAIVAKLSAGPAGLPQAGGGIAAKVAAPPSRPAAAPATRGKSAAKGRQARAMRKAVAALVVLSLTGVTAGAVEIKLHSLSFFLFRNTGAGAGNPGDLEENQGPGQPDAPKPHHLARTPGTGAPPRRSAPNGQ
jgi:hypothetical protein